MSKQPTKKIGNKTNSEGLHEEFFLKDRFYSTHKNEIRKYLKGKKVSLFYPGTGKDVFVPVKYLYQYIDEFYFNDIDERYIDELKSSAFRQKFNESDISISNYTMAAEGDIKISAFDLSINGRDISCKFLHCAWEKAFAWFKQRDIKVSFLYLYGYGGGGGSEFLEIYRKGVDEPYCIKDLVTPRFIVIEDGTLKFRHINQYQDSNNGFHFLINTIEFEVRFSEILESRDELDGIFITNNDQELVFHDYDPRIDDDPSALCNSKQHIIPYEAAMKEYDFMKKLLQVSLKNKWEIVGTTSNTSSHSMGYLLAIKEWKYNYPQRVILFMSWMASDADLRQASLVL